MTKAHFDLSRAAGALPRVTPNASVESIVDQLRSQGAVIIENLLCGDALSAVQSDLEPWFANAPCGEGAFFGKSTRRFGALFCKSPHTIDLACHPLVVSVMESLLCRQPNVGAVCNTIEISATQAIGIEPGEPAQFLHRDEELWPFPHDFEIMANAMWAIGDFTVENGATRIIPGSHYWPLDQHPCPGESVPAEPDDQGACLGGTLHGGGANVSNGIRRGVVFSYKLGWLAPQEKLLLSIPPEDARRLPEKLQRLIGYQLHKPNLGWIEGRDPIEWLRGDVQIMAAATDNLTPAHEALLADVEANPSLYQGYLA